MKAFELIVMKVVEMFEIKAKHSEIVRDTDNERGEVDGIAPGSATVKRIIVIKRRLDVSDKRGMSGARRGCLLNKQAELGARGRVPPLALCRHDEHDSCSTDGWDPHPLQRTGDPQTSAVSAQQRKSTATYKEMWTSQLFSK